MSAAASGTRQVEEYVALWLQDPDRRSLPRCPAIMWKWSPCYIFKNDLWTNCFRGQAYDCARATKLPFPSKTVTHEDPSGEVAPTPTRSKLPGRIDCWSNV